MAKGPPRFNHSPMENGIVAVAGGHVGTDRSNHNDQKEENHSGLPEEGDQEHEGELH